MLPPVPTTTQEKNPRFARLYQEIVQSRLNPDGTTKVIKQQRAAADVEKALYEHRIDLARRQLVQGALSDVIAGNSLPEELLQASRVVLAMLSHQISPSDAEILHDDLTRFTQNSPAIAAAISTSLLTSTHTLAHIASPSSRLPVNQLPAHINALQTSIARDATSIDTLRARLADTLAQVASTHRDALELSVRILEQTMHGSVARGVRARAEHLGVVAKGVDLKVRILGKSDSFIQAGGEEDPTLGAAMRGYGEELGGKIELLMGQVGEMEEEVKGYKRERGMTQIAERYAVVLKRKGDLEREVERIEGEM
ncbi:hypothetical protein BT63DRAFT_100981 [Microthyrium microscopicum]|uniref:Uncharacterized protein n=1 Tax=Microthyrium microscopicum TaxID=703497 RepID=A0A6A6TYQ1_9PEZI|nr:hypothetical protein BT63DRAFT_100981 [Microthyrium microscopicum]